MLFKAAILLALVAASIAAPVQKRAVLAEEDYADFQVSDGVAGNAQAEVESHFNVRKRLCRLARGAHQTDCD